MDGFDTYTEKPGYTWPADVAFADVNPADYVALVIPGGRARRPSDLLPWPGAATAHRPAAAAFRGAGNAASARRIMSTTASSGIAVESMIRW